MGTAVGIAHGRNDRDSRKTSRQVLAHCDGALVWPVEVGNAVFLVTVTDVADVAVCRVEGDLDGMTASRFRQALAGCFRRPALVIDLSDLLFIDGAGLSALVGGIRRARELSVEVVVACNQQPLRKVFEQIGLNLIVSVAGPTDDALAEVRSAPALRRPSV